MSYSLQPADVAPRTFRLFVSCPRHIEALLRDELSMIVAEHARGAAATAPDATPDAGPDATPDEAPELPQPRESAGGVYLEVEPAIAYRVCLWSRLAGRVYLECGVGTVANRDELYRFSASVAWESWFGLEAGFAVSAHTVHPAFSRSSFAALVVKDAIADRFREQYGKRPSVDTDSPDVRVFLHLTEREARLYLDLSGESLHRRGYRLTRTEAPLRENTAAAVLARGGWQRAVTAWREGGAPPPLFFDPLCGSGTLAIEAALVALDRAPGALRERFGFERLAGFDAAAWRSLREEAARRAAAGREAWAAAGGRVWASDHDPDAVAAARENADRAELGEEITFAATTFERLSRGALLGSWNKVYGAGERFPGFVVTNPPYGVRLSGVAYPSDSDHPSGGGRATGGGAAAQTEDARGGGQAVQTRLGAWLARTLRGARATVLAESKEQARLLGLRAEKLYSLYNGKLAIVAAVLDLGSENEFQTPGGGPGGAPGGAAATGPRSAPQSGGGPGFAASEGGAMLLRRLMKNWKTLQPYLERERVSCYRLYDADIPQYAAAVDLYTAIDRRRYLVVQEYAAPATVDSDAAEARLEELIDTVTSFLELPKSAVSTKQRRRRRGGAGYAPQRSDRGSSGRARRVTVEENGLRFEVDLAGYIDTGLFLDHRILRDRVREWIRERPGNASRTLRVLNLFAYTCSVSVYAASAGVREVVSVDSSNTYLEWGRRNFELNNLPTGRHRFVRADCRDFLRRDDGRYDVIFIDPPSFSNTSDRSDTFEVQRDHAELIDSAAERLAPGGLIVFSSNLRGFRLDDSLRQRYNVREISEETLPPDFERRRKQRHVFSLLRPEAPRTRGPRS